MAESGPRSRASRRSRRRPSDARHRPERRWAYNKRRRIDRFGKKRRFCGCPCFGGPKPTSRDPSVANDSTPKLASRPWRYALVRSAALHSVLLVGAALCALHLRTPAVDAGRVEAAFSTPEVGEWAVVPPVRLIESDPVDGGQRAEGRTGVGQGLTDVPSLPGTDDAKSSQPRLARNAQPLGSRWLSETRAQGDLTEIVGAAQGRSGPPTDGTGGAGRGGGAGKSTFFGLGASGRRVAFVVDASASMNHPYLGEAKTRIGQLKLELAKSILSLTEDQQFFIVFFNEHAIPMPAAGMEHAYAANQQRFLNW